MIALSVAEKFKNSLVALLVGLFVGAAVAWTALVALLQVLLPEGERRYLRDCGITRLPLAQLNAVLAPMGYVIVATKTRLPDRFVVCTDAHGQIERYGLFELQRIEEEA